MKHFQPFGSQNISFHALKVFLQISFFSFFPSPPFWALGDTPGQEARGNWTLMNGHTLYGLLKDEHHFYEITIETRQKNAYFPATGSRNFGNNKWVGR